MVTSKTAEQRYQEKLRPAPTGCIEWSASIDKYGNAKFSYTEQGKKKDTSGHKFGWVLANGPVPEGMKLKNTCLLRSCQNMAHWVLQGDGKGLTLQERYEARFTRLGPDECWPWQEDSRDKNGYGLLAYRDENGKAVVLRATRFGWGLAYPDNPLGDHHVCHTCDSPPCQNPRHWFKGTNADNMADMVKKRRATGPGRGEDHHRTELTWDDVWEIRRRYARGLTTQRELAAEFSISREAIGHIVRNERWVVDENGDPVTSPQKKEQ
jgi:hypothetical protein